MFEQQLIEAEEILEKASNFLIKEAYVNWLMDANDMPPNVENDVDVLSDLSDIQTSIQRLRERAAVIPAS